MLLEGEIQLQNVTAATLASAKGQMMIQERVRLEIVCSRTQSSEVGWTCGG